MAHNPCPKLPALIWDLPEHAEQFVGEVAASTWAAGGASFAVEALAEDGRP